MSDAIRVGEDPIARGKSRLFTPERVPGVDAARGLAVLGMLGAHLAVTGTLEPTDPGSWLAVVNGRSSILFAVLAGVSLALLSGGTVVHSGERLVQDRLKILVRAVAVFVLGGVLSMLGTRIAVILEYYAVLFVVALPFLRWRPRPLFVLAAVLAVIMPVAQLIAVRALEESGLDMEVAIVDLGLTGFYPALVWVVFVLLGLAVGRCDLKAARTAGILVAAGTATALLGYGTGTWAESTGAADRGFRDIWDLGALATTEPHSGSPFEVVGSGGFALVVLGVCLLVAQRAAVFLFPLIATGSLALSVYTAQLLAVTAIGDAAFEQTDNGLFLVTTLITLAVSSVWAWFLGRGPLEELLTAMARRASTPRPAHSGEDPPA